MKEISIGGNVARGTARLEESEADLGVLRYANRDEMIWSKKGRHDDESIPKNSYLQAPFLGGQRNITIMRHMDPFVRLS